MRESLPSRSLCSFSTSSNPPPHILLLLLLLLVPRPDLATSNRQGPVLFPKHPGRSIRLIYQKSVHKNGWCITAACMFQLAEGRAVLLVYTAIGSAWERVPAVSLALQPFTSPPRSPFPPEQRYFSITHDTPCFCLGRSYTVIHTLITWSKSRRCMLPAKYFDRYIVYMHCWVRRVVTGQRLQKNWGQRNDNTLPEGKSVAK